MARQITIAKFAEWIADELNVDRVLDLVAGGKTLQAVCREVSQPYTCLARHFSDGEAATRYAAARKAWADAVMDEAMEIADGVQPDKNHVAKAKLRIETRMNQAGAYHRDRWGEQADAQRMTPVIIQVANLRGGEQRLEVSTPVALPGPEDVN